MSSCRILIDDCPGSGDWNMAVDETLLLSTIERQESIFRWYQWSTATISLGYFQRADFARNHPKLSQLPMVRRLTGGGAILHHHELTYSCVLPACHPLCRNPVQIYSVVHVELVAALIQRGFPAKMRGTSLPQHGQEFLCFGRGDAHDVVLLGFKVLGSAQRRKKGAVLQHGSLLLHWSEHAAEFPGILDLAPQPFFPREFAEDTAEKIGRIFQEEIAPSQLTADEVERAAILAARSYSTVDGHGVDHRGNP